MGVIYKNGIPYAGTVDNYNILTNKPSINNVSLLGNKNTSDLNFVDNDTLEVDTNEKIAIKAIPYSYSNNTLTLFATEKSSSQGE